MQSIGVVPISISVALGRHTVVQVLQQGASPLLARIDLWLSPDGRGVARLPIVCHPSALTPCCRQTACNDTGLSAGVSHLAILTTCMLHIVMCGIKYLRPCGWSQSRVRSRLVQFSDSSAHPASLGYPTFGGSGIKYLRPCGWSQSRVRSRLVQFSDSSAHPASLGYPTVANDCHPAGENSCSFPFPEGRRLRLQLSFPEQENLGNYGFNDFMLRRVPGSHLWQAVVPVTETVFAITVSQSSLTSSRLPVVLITETVFAIVPYKSPLPVTNCQPFRPEA
ncbi:hypothetical protein Bbelb_203690 [Branchiostoma belcheri]|nr:hypothetical protein Bbelb_203690 [Branchiostoma belcheri]